MKIKSRSEILELDRIHDFINISKAPVFTTRLDINNSRNSFFKSWCTNHSIYSYLYHLSSSLNGSGNVIEIGFGHTSVFLSYGSNNSNSNFLSIDIGDFNHNKSPVDKPFSHSTYLSALEVVLELGVDKTMKLEVLDFNDFVKNDIPNMDLFFYDGPKEIDELNLIPLVIENISSGGFFVMHDFNGDIRSRILEIISDFSCFYALEIIFIDEPETLIFKKG